MTETAEPSTEPQVDDLDATAAVARLRALHYLAVNREWFVDAYSVSVFGGYGGEADLEMQAHSGETARARRHFGVTGEPRVSPSGCSTWTHRVGPEGRSIVLHFIEDGS